MNKAVFLDRDGTINIDKDYLYKPEEFEFIDGVIESLRILQEAGYLLIIITNQSGIARGFYTENDLAVLNDWMIDKLHEHDVNIDAIYYCPHLVGAPVKKYDYDCDCRKPRKGLFTKAIHEWDLNISQCIAIGDKIRDCQPCVELGGMGILISDSEKEEIIESVRNNKYKDITYALDLREAVGCVVRG